ncbi:MAG TPA: hypothetical protein VIL30_04145 [Ramlibacter sp.]
MPQSSPLRALVPVVFSVLVSGCAGWAPGWDWPGGASRASVAISAAPAQAPAPAAGTQSDECHRHAWYRSFESPAARDLVYARAYTDCMQARTAAGNPPPAAPSAPPPSVQVVPGERLGNPPPRADRR